MKKTIVLFLLVVFAFAKAYSQQSLSPQALHDNLFDMAKQPTTLIENLENIKGKKVMLYVWASWCVPCIETMPKMIAFQEAYPDIEFLMLSMDINLEKWLDGIVAHHVPGEHYFVRSGQWGDLAAGLALDYIPRYILLDEEHNVLLFKIGDLNNPKLAALIAQ